MSDNSKHGMGVVENVLHVPDAVYGIDYSSNTELEVMLHHAANGRKIPFTMPQITAELKRRTARSLASTVSTQIDELVAEINGEYRRLEERGTNDTVIMSIDYAKYRHNLLSTHVDRVRRGVNRLKRIMAPVRSWSVLPAESEVQPK